MKKKVLAICLFMAFVMMMAGCAKQEETNEEAQTQEDTVVEENAEETEQDGVIKPLPATVDVNNLSDCMVAVSLDEKDAFVNEDGKVQMKVKVWTYDLYDMVDMANLKEGDTIVIQGNEVVVESLETLESGLVFINGGMENGGYDLWHNDSGVYFEHGYNDAKSYYALGEATIRVSTEFEFVDSSDLDKGEVTYYPGDFLTDNAGILYHFVPNNTSIVVEGGQIIQMTRIYTP
jgi:hypothetical protein